MSGEPIGQVDLISGDVIRVSVNIDTGETNMTIVDRRSCHVSWPARIRQHEVASVMELLAKAASVAPAIAAAHSVRQRAIQTAEASYERIVANAIGRAK